MKRMVGLSLGDLQKKFGPFAALTIAREAGADSVEFSTSNGPWWDYQVASSIYSQGDEGVAAHFAALKAHADALGLVISQTHGRLTGYVGDPVRDAVTLENARLDLLAAHCLQAPVCVMHSVSTSRVGPLVPPAAMRSLNLRMFHDILPYARAYGVKVALETFGDSPRDGVIDFFGQADELLASYEAIANENGSDWLTLCIDTGHSNKAMRFGQPTPANVIRLLGNRISVLHLNDNDTITDQHKLPLSGCIDWSDVLAALDEIGFHGAYNMELRLGCFGAELMADTAAFAIKVMRQLLVEQYGQDA